MKAKIVRNESDHVQENRVEGLFMGEKVRLRIRIKGNVGCEGNVRESRESLETVIGTVIGVNDEWILRLRLGEK